MYRASRKRRSQVDNAREGGHRRAVCPRGRPGQRAASPPRGQLRAGNSLGGGGPEAGVRAGSTSCFSGWMFEVLRTPQGQSLPQDTSKALSRFSLLGCPRGKGGQPVPCAQAHFRLFDSCMGARLWGARLGAGPLSWVASAADLRSAASWVYRPAS